MSNRRRISVSLLALSVIFVTAGTLSAFADDDSYARSMPRIRTERSPTRLQVPRPRYVRNVKAGAISTPRNTAPDDACDLPSTGCGSFLAN
jgi:hypothetical protein